jgi:hypothetical protein
MTFDRMLYDLTGRIFGRLTVVKFAEEASLRNPVSLWFCICSCGNFTGAKNSISLKQGGTQSCGCLKREALKMAWQCERKQRAA